MEVQTPVGIDPEQVRSSDIIGCDYDSPNIPFDKTTDRERAEAYYEEPE